MQRVVLLAGLLMLATAAHATDDALRADLERLAHERIYFAHQSVGANILAGVGDLARQAGVPIRIVEAPNAAAVAPGTFGHFFVPENGKPLEKLANFKAALGSRSGIDLALIKFCFVDINADTDAAALFAHYQAAIAQLKAANPHTTFVHVTLPLTTVQTGPKALAKRLLGRAPYGTIENVRREQYNALLRRTYAGREPVFDIARVESTAPDGTKVTVTWDGVVVPAMSPAYTTDGGHLNEAGRVRVARELVRVLTAASQPLQKIEAFATPVRLTR